jgi:membrane-bound ClpP family serine protease
MLGQTGGKNAGGPAILPDSVVVSIIFLATQFGVTRDAPGKGINWPMAGNFINGTRCLRPGVAAWMAFMVALGVSGIAGGANESDAEADAAKNTPAAAEDDPAKGRAAPPELGDGRLIRIRLPLTGNADEHFKSVIQRALSQLQRAPRHEPADQAASRRPLLILELLPQQRDGNFGAGTDFTRALKLATFLTSTELNAVKTVAYIPRTIKGHGVLIALACDEIAMHPDAEIGDAAIDEDASRPIDPSIVSNYQQINARSKPLPEAIALSMVDRKLEVLKVETDKGGVFVPREGLDALKRTHTIISEETLVQAGSLGNFSGRDARGHHFIATLASDPEELAHLLSLKPEAVKQDQSLVGDWRPVMLTIDGPISRRKLRQIETLIAAEIRDRDVNFIGIKIDSTGGRLEDCKQLAETIAALNAEEVQTVAYVPVEASGGAALVALACDQLVMQPEAHVGGKGSSEGDRQTLDDAVKSIETLAQNTDHTWSLLAAMIDPDIELFTYNNTKTGSVRLFSKEEAGQQPEANIWRMGPRIKPAGEALRLDSRRAKELDVATHVVDSFDDFKQLYGFHDDVRVAEPNWALELVEALSSPGLAVLLLVIGFVGVYVELHSPGMGAGAFVATVAFMLFFWSQYLHGTAEWLEILLFLAGVFFLLIELLILPGFGIFGLGGAAMILLSLVLASQTFVLPRTESQMAELRHSLTIVAAATLGVVAAAIALRRYLPQTPVFRTLMLTPPPEEELIDLDYRESLADFTHLIGQQGVAATNLMPAGKAEFDGELVDVIAEGLPIDRGQAVVVTKARGNRVLVRTVGS